MSYKMYIHDDGSMFIFGTQRYTWASDQYGVSLFKIVLNSDGTVTLSRYDLSSSLRYYQYAVLTKINKRYFYSLNTGSNSSTTGITYYANLSSPTATSLPQIGRRGAGWEGGGGYKVYATTIDRVNRVCMTYSNNKYYCCVWSYTSDSTYSDIGIGSYTDGDTDWTATGFYKNCTGNSAMKRPFLIYNGKAYFYISAASGSFNFTGIWSINLADQTVAKVSSFTNANFASISDIEYNDGYWVAVSSVYTYIPSSSSYSYIVYVFYSTDLVSWTVTSFDGGTNYTTHIIARAGQ